MTRFIRPIPKAVLIHEIELKTPDDSSGWGGETSDGVEIKSVRVDPANRYERTAETAGKAFTHRLLIDRYHSTPFPAEIEVGSTVVWKGTEYEVLKSNPFYDFKELPHHYEVELG